MFLTGLLSVVSAQFAPPGLLFSLQVDPDQSVPFVTPFVPSDLSPADLFDDQIVGLTLSVHQWDAQTQTWNTATHDSVTGWTGDVITLVPGEPFWVHLSAAAPQSIVLSLGGVLQAEPLEQTLHPGLNPVSAPRFAASPLTAWNWHQTGVPGANVSAADLLHDADNQAQAWLQDDNGFPVWTGISDPSEPGQLLPLLPYFYEHKGTVTVQAEGEPLGTYDSNVLPSVTRVEYDPGQNAALVTVATADEPGQSLDLFYLDIDFPPGHDPEASWQVWQLGHQPGSGSEFVIPDSSLVTQNSSLRLYQVADALQDSSGDGLSDAYKSLVLGLDPNAFTPTPENAQSLTRQVWWNLPGLHVNHLTTAPAFPWHPDMEEELTPVFDTPRNIASNYGQRVFGQFHPPVTGNYIFKIASDDHSELWLTRGGNREQVAFVHGYTGWQLWTKYASQISEPLFLEAGNTYPMEVLMKEKGGGDHLSVGVHFPTLRIEAPMRSDWFLPPFDSAVDPDSDGDGLPDSWELSHGLDPNDPTDAEGDLSGDGISNLEVFLLGLDPVTFHSLPENAPALTRQVFSDISGKSVQDLRVAATFPFDHDEEHIQDGVNDRFEAPSNFANDYGQRMFGRFHTPMSGEYTFWIASDDQSELWTTANGDRHRIAHVASYTGERQWDKSGSQKSDPVFLTAGSVYILDVLMKESGGNDHLAIGVQLPDGRYERPVRARRFLTPPESVSYTQDTDGDGLSDYEEWVFGTDPALVDTSGDGISDFDKIVWGMDPLAFGSKAPPVPGLWVLEHGFNPDVPFLHLDSDGDGLTNLEEYHYGTNPNLWDTDGDGVSDYVEVNHYGTDPTVNDIGSFSTIDTLILTQGQGTDGQWDTNNARTRLESFKGAWSQPFTLQNAGMYEIAITAETATFQAVHTRYEVEAYVNGEFVQTLMFHLEPGQTDQNTVVLPWLNPGEHDLVLKFINFRLSRRIQFNSIVLGTRGGPDTNGNGITDWAEALLSERNAVETPETGSLVSPYFFEGRGQFVSFHRFTGDGEPAEVNPAPGDRWFANVPLSSESATLLTVSLENGAHTEIRSLTWLPARVPDHHGTTFRLRPGDSLRLSPAPETADPVTSTGQGTLYLDAQMLESGMSAGQTLPLQFEQPGLYQIASHWVENGIPVEASFTVEVIGYAFPDSPVAQAGISRTWSLPGFPADLTLETDSRLNATLMSGSTSGIHLITDVARDRWVAARLDPDGPILAVQRVRGLRVARTNATHIQLLEIDEDGTRLIETAVVQSDVYPETVITYQIFKAGVLFDTGSNVMILTAADFDENGVAFLRFLMPSSVNGSFCHRTRVHDGDIFIGTPGG